MKKLLTILFIFSSYISIGQTYARPEYDNRMFVSYDGLDTLFIEFEGDTIKIESTDSVWFGKLMGIDAGTSISFGTDGQIPYMNPGGTDLIYGGIDYGIGGIKIDTIVENTASNGVLVENMLFKDGTYLKSSGSWSGLMGFDQDNNFDLLIYSNSTWSSSDYFQIGVSSSFGQFRMQGAAGYSELLVNNTGLQITDQLNTSGMRYLADYSSDGVSNYGDRWITDKGYIANVLLNKITASDDTTFIANHVKIDSNLYVGGTQIKSTGTISDNDATPDVSGAEIWTYNGTANSVTITDLDNPEIGAIYAIVGNSDTYTVTINDSGNFNISEAIILGLDDIVFIYVQADNDYIQWGKLINN